jgi:hypothetical protein
MAELEALPSRVSKRRRLHKTAESNYERNKILKDKGVVSVQVFEFTEAF